MAVVTLAHHLADDGRQRKQLMAYLSISLILVSFPAAANSQLTLTPSGLTTFQDSQATYYRQLVIDSSSGAVYVGAMEFLFRLDLRNISNSESPLFAKSVNLSTASNVAYNTRGYTGCVARGFSSDYHCKNHVRSILLYPATQRVYVCLTGGSSQQDVFFDTATLRQVTYGQYGSGLLKCSVNPDDATTITLVADGGPASQVSTTISAAYTDTVSGGQATDAAVYRPVITSPSSPRHNVIRTPLGNFASGAQFVNSFQSASAVYIFLREQAQEVACSYCRPVTYSRVGRICKADKGGSQGSGYETTSVTFLKARLNCYLPGSADNAYFDQIYDVVDTTVDGIRRFYAVFTSSQSGVFGSAVCSYSQSAIDGVFNTSSYLMQDPQNPNSFWQATNPTFNNRPGRCDYDTSQPENDGIAKFMSGKPLMNDLVMSDQGQPVFYASDAILQRIALDTTPEGSTVLYLASNDGRVFKVSQPSPSSTSRLLLILQPAAPLLLPIWTLAISGDSVVASTDDRVMQFSKYQCDVYKSCDRCLVDPHCGWSRDTGACSIYTAGLLQDLTSTDPLATCNAVTPGSDATYCHGPDRPSISVELQGLPVHLSCSSPCQSPTVSVSWTLDFRPLPLSSSSSKYVLTSQGDLVVFNVTQDDEGMYRCQSQTTPTVVLAAQYVNVTECVSAQCTWKRAFLNWCDAFKQYKTNFNQWACYKEVFVESVQQNETCLPSNSLSRCPASSSQPLSVSLQSSIP